MKKIHLLLLLGIFILALAIRLYGLDALPLYIDETAGHYLINTKEVFRSSTAPLGFIAVIFWRSFSLTWLLGYTVLGVRLPSVLYGTLILIPMFLVGSVIKKDKLSFPCLSVVLTAILPWSFMISRIGYANIPIIVNLVLLHLYFFLKAKTVKGYLFSFLFLLLALPFYQSMVIIMPAVSIFVFQALWRVASRKEKTWVLVSAIVLTALIISPVISRFRLLSSSGRGLDLAIWRDINTSFESDKYRALSWNSRPSIFSLGLPPEKLANKIVYNQVTANLSIFARNYLSFFSPDWLFLRGDSILRHSTGQMGAFYAFLLPFMLYGAFKFFKDSDKKARATFFVWILVSPIPAAITKDGAGYLLRAVTLLPFLTYFCALGLIESIALVKKKWQLLSVLLLTLIGLYSAYYFFYGYFHVYPALSVRAYEYGFKEISDFQVAKKGETIIVVWDGYYPVGHFLFWQKVPFSEYKKMKITPIEIGQTIFWKTLPNLYFVVPRDLEDIPQFIKEYQPNYLVLPDRYFVKWSDELLELTDEKISEINYLDKTTAFTIYSVKR